MTQQRSIPDWIHLPHTSDTVSLWPSLHDGELIGVRSDLMACTIVLEVDVIHLRQFHKLDEDLRFVIIFGGVQSARANAISVWPGPVPEVQGKQYEEQNRLVEEYQAKCREESVRWSDFEAGFPVSTMDIYSADMVCDDRTTTTHLQGHVNGPDYDDVFTSLFIRAREIQFRQSNGVELTLEHFIKLGVEYWEAFSARSERA